MLDYSDVLGMLSDEDRQVQVTARDFLEAEAMYDIADWWERGEFPAHLVPKLAEMGYLGANLPVEYGGMGNGFLTHAYMNEVLASRLLMQVVDVLRHD